MHFLEEQMEGLRIMEKSMDECYQTHNRAMCVQNMQLILEMIFTI